MPYGDGIPKINCYSLTDFHDFESCPFRFLVRHHLDKKYEIDESSPAIALGNLLDQSIKRFHKENCYGTKSSNRLIKLVKDSESEMRYLVAKAQNEGKNHFFAATIPYLTEDIVNEAIKVFTDYYVKRKGNIKRALCEVGFCEYPIKCEGDNYKLWGGPDCIEIGEDGMPEIADYKSRINLENGKAYMDMDLMPKMYVLLCSKKLLEMGHKTARFVVRFWQDPLDESFYEEFNIEAMSGQEFLFKQKIQKITGVKEFKPCGKQFCAACKSDKKDKFIKELEQKGFKVMSGEEFLGEMPETRQQGSDGLPF